MFKQVCTFKLGYFDKICEATVERKLVKDKKTNKIEMETYLSK
jgi:hypothetical protein